MKKADLKSGMTVYFEYLNKPMLVLLDAKNGSDVICDVSPKKIEGVLRNHNYFELSHFNDDLTTKSHLDNINKVVSCYGVTLWEREEEVVFNENHIYAFKGNGNVIYKLHRVNDVKYAWIDMSSSQCYANGNSNAKDCIKYVVDGIKCFKTQKEFAEWLIENV